MTEHPMYSDKDNQIKNLEERIRVLEKVNEGLEKANENLSYHRREEIKRKVGKLFKAFLLIAFISPIVTGGGYGIYRCESGWNYLDKRCSKLCEMAIGNLSIGGQNTTDETCRDANRYCECQTRLGTTVTLPRTPHRELSGDLSNILRHFDIASWKYCMSVKDKTNKHFFSELQCSHIPWKVGLNAKAEQDRVDGGND